MTEGERETVLRLAGCTLVAVGFLALDGAVDNGWARVGAVLGIILFAATAGAPAVSLAGLAAHVVLARLGGRRIYEVRLGGGPILWRRMAGDVEWVLGRNPWGGGRVIDFAADPAPGAGPDYALCASLRAGRFQEALTRANAVLADWPDHVETHLSRLCALHALHGPRVELEAARTVLRRLKAPELHVHAAWAAVVEGDPKLLPAARRHADAACEALGYAGGAAVRGAVLIAEGAFERGARLLGPVIQADDQLTGKAGGCGLMARAARGLGDNDRARAWEGLAGHLAARHERLYGWRPRTGFFEPRD